MTGRPEFRLFQFLSKAGVTVSGPFKKKLLKKRGFYDGKGPSGERRFSMLAIGG